MFHHLVTRPLCRHRPAVIAAAAVVAVVGFSESALAAGLATPTDLAAVREPTNEAPELTWRPVAGAESYRIYRGGSLLARPTTTRFVDTRLPSDGRYVYSVSAVGAGGAASAISAGVAVRRDTVAPLPVATAPSGPTTTTTAPSMTWNGSPYNGGTTVNRYTVLRDGGAIATTTTRTFVDETVGDGAHAYAVVAIDAAGNRSTPSPSLTVVVDRAGPPAVPITASVSPSAQVPVVSWASVADAAAYEVLRGGELVGRTVWPTFTDNNVPGDGTYTYTVRAVDENGNKGPLSNAATVAFVRAPGSAYTGVSQRMSNVVDLRWLHNLRPELKLMSPFFRWADVEPRADVYDWTALDGAIAEAHAGGYRLIVRISAGADAPGWLYSSAASGGLPVSSLRLLSTEPGSGHPGEITIPEPFDPDLLVHYRDLIAALDDHLATFGDATGTWRRADAVYFVPVAMPTEIGTEMPLAFGKGTFTGTYRGVAGTYDRYAVNKAEWLSHAVGANETAKMTYLRQRVGQAWLDAVQAHMDVLTHAPSAVAYGAILWDNQTTAARIATEYVGRYPTRLWSMTTNLQPLVLADGSLRPYAEWNPRAAEVVRLAGASGGIIGFQTEAGSVVNTCARVAYSTNDGFTNYGMRFYETSHMIKECTDLYRGDGNLQARLAQRFGG